MNMNEDNIRPAEATQQPADLKDDVEAINTHCLAQSARPWIHATYHSVISVLGISAVLSLPLSFTYLGWAGGMILFIASTFTSFYSGQLLIQCQDVTKHKTYSSLADGIMGDGWSMRWLRPFQGIVFITVLISTIIAAGQFMVYMDIEVDGNQNLSNSSWYAIAGLMLLIVSLAPDLEKSWKVSFIGTQRYWQSSCILLDVAFPLVKWKMQHTTFQMGTLQLNTQC